MHTPQGTEGSEPRAALPTTKAFTWDWLSSEAPGRECGMTKTGQELFHQEWARTPRIRGPPEAAPLT